jgi:cytochrome P450
MAPRTASPPGPRGVPGLGVLPAFGRDPIAYCLAARERHGDVVRLPIGPASVYLVSHPDDVRQVLVSDGANYHKGALFRRTAVLFGNGLVLNDGESWSRQRRMMQPAFTLARLETLVPLMVPVVEAKLRAWSRRGAAGGPVEMSREMMALTLGIVGRTMFGEDITEAELDALAEDFDTVLRHLTVRLVTFALPERTPLPGRRGCDAALGRIDALVHRIVERRRTSGARPDDLLTHLLEATDEDGHHIDARQMRDEIVTTLFGGYEATAHALVWTWYLLDRNPDADRRFRAEVQRVLGDRDPTYADLRELAFTGQVILEALRLYPPFWEVFRASHGGTEIGGWPIPPNASILMSPFVTHRHPDFWADPEAFRPERFADGRAPFGQAYFPFGAGPRTCIGRRMAILEMTLILAMIARRHRPALPAGHVVRLRAHSTVRPAGGLPMRLLAA